MITISLRPRHRRLEAFTTDSKIIRLITRRVAIVLAAAAQRVRFSTAIAIQLIEKNSVVIPPNFRPCGFIDKWTEVFPVDKNLHRPMPLHWLSLRCFWSNLVTSIDLQLPAFFIFLHQEWLISHFHTYSISKQDRYARALPIIGHLPRFWYWMNWTVKNSVISVIASKNWT